MKRIIALLAVTLASAGIAFAQAPAAPAKDAKKPDAAAPAKKPALMDINSASPKELATLPGIGDARSIAIVKGRPYKGKDDLVQKKILTQKVYDDIKDLIIAKQTQY
jgi:competence protein ComEA